MHKTLPHVMCQSKYCHKNNAVKKMNSEHSSQSYKNTILIIAYFRICAPELI